MSNVIQSILPSLSTCNSRLFNNNRTSWICPQEIQEIKWLISAIHLRVKPRGRPGSQLIEITKSQKSPIYSGSLGVLDLSVNGIARRALDNTLPQPPIKSVIYGSLGVCGRLFSGASSPSAHPFLATHRNCFKALS